MSRVHVGEASRLRKVLGRKFACLTTARQELDIVGGQVYPLLITIIIHHQVLAHSIPLSYLAREPAHRKYLLAGNALTTHMLKKGIQVVNAAFQSQGGSPCLFSIPVDLDPLANCSLPQ